VYLGALSEMQEAGEDKQAQSTVSTLLVYVRQAISHHAARCDLQGLPTKSTTLLINTAITFECTEWMNIDSQFTNHEKMAVCCAVLVCFTFA
jgi:hypothetical protein